LKKLCWLAEIFLRNWCRRLLSCWRSIITAKPTSARSSLWPGSFTGLRVGLAAIKALGEILQKPIVPVSLLEVAALASAVQGRVMVALDGGREEIYAGEYEVQNDTPHVISERLLTKQECLSRSAEASLPIVTRDPALAASAREAGRSVIVLETIDATMIARLGWKKLQAGVNVSPHELEANYIRRSDAEIFAKG